jgi:uncharacterized membrane protein
MPSCPISNERVNERVARIVGLLVFLTAMLALWKPSSLWLALLSVDFAARSFYRPWSLFANLARPLALRWGAPQIVDAAPKIFAARIGLGLTLAAWFFAWIGIGSLSEILLGIMAICAFLEAFFGYCVGCSFYSLWKRIVRQN